MTTYIGAAIVTSDGAAIVTSVGSVASVFCPEDMENGSSDVEEITIPFCSSRCAQTLLYTTVAYDNYEFDETCDACGTLIPASN
jgi:hypothetical protein